MRERRPLQTHLLPIAFLGAIIATDAMALRDFCYFGSATLVPGTAFPTAVKDVSWTIAENLAFELLQTETYITGPPGTLPSGLLYEVPLPYGGVLPKHQSALVCAPVAGTYTIYGSSQLCLIEWEYPDHLYCPAVETAGCPAFGPYVISGPLPANCP